MLKYLESKSLKFEKCGKLIVAVNEEEKERLEKIFENGKENGVEGLKLLSSKESQKMEPFCTSAVASIHSPNTGIADFASVAESYMKEFQEMGGKVVTEFQVEKVDKFDNEIVIHPKQRSQNLKFKTSKVITCGGVYADRVSILFGGDKHPAIIPFRGDWSHPLFFSKKN